MPKRSLKLCLPPASLFGYTTGKPRSFEQVVDDVMAAVHGQDWRPAFTLTTGYGADRQVDTAKAVVVYDKSPGLEYLDDPFAEAPRLRLDLHRFTVEAMEYGLQQVLKPGWDIGLIIRYCDADDPFDGPGFAFFAYRMKRSSVDA